MIEIRVIGADDWRLWREARLAALAGAPEAYATRLSEWQGAGDREQRWRDRLSIPGARDLIALRAGKPVGIATGVPEPEDDAAELISMWVDDSARGTGVGDRLIAALESWAVERGYTALRLGVFAENEPAIGLYLRNGFEFREESGGSAHAPGITATDDRVERTMVKTISRADAAVR
ncbi:GNAT family N-acetyltransferase [Nocardia nova]|uniref:GNAT family N-acetyltransferase n=1 Tax=Nocardia nova TaxID=37330 RepID=UPI00046D74BE|nr:GNAT family N-acetyltransferase [Nocardia nova]